MGADNTPWPTERVEQLRALFNAGIGCTEIGRQLGCSKNAVIAKLTRIGLAGTRPRMTPAQSRRTKTGWLPTAQAAKPLALARPALAVEGGKRVSNPLGHRAGQLATAPKPIGPEKIAADQVTPTARPWEERRSAECAWPIEADGRSLSCCAPTGDRKLRYCPEHAALAFRAAPPPSKRDISRLAALR